MRTFDYSFLESGMLPAHFVNTVSEIAVLAERVNNRRGGLGEVLEMLEPIAAERSVEATAKISNISDDDKLTGYRESLTLIHDDSAHPAFRENIQEDDFLRLHKILLPTSRGYKSSPVSIEVKLKGNQCFKFSPISHQETRLAVQQLVNAYAKARENTNINRLLLIPCVVFDFLCIYPFAEGNGRMSRLLSLLLLFKSGYDVGRYISFEEKILVSTDDYFAAIRESSVGWHENRSCYFPFMKHFLSTLLLCYKELDNYKGNSRDSGNSRQITKTQQIRDFVLSHLIPVSKQAICSALPDVSSTTVESVLGKMMKEGLIEKIGGGCVTKYVVNKHPKHVE